MFIFIFLDALFRKADVAARRLPAKPPKEQAMSFLRVRPAIRNISRRRLHDHDR